MMTTPTYIAKIPLGKMDPEAATIEVRALGDLNGKTHKIRPSAVARLCLERLEKALGTTAAAGVYPVFEIPLDHITRAPTLSLHSLHITKNIPDTEARLNTLLRQNRPDLVNNKSVDRFGEFDEERTAVILQALPQPSMQASR